MNVGSIFEKHLHDVDLIGTRRARKGRALIIGTASVYLGTGFEQEAGTRHALRTLAWPINQMDKEGAVSIILGRRQTGVRRQQDAKGIKVTVIYRRGSSSIWRIRGCFDHEKPVGFVWMDRPVYQRKASTVTSMCHIVTL